MTIYEKIGGSDAVNAAVDLFYEKILADTSLAGFFNAVDMAHLKGHQRAFITAAIGGPEAYSGRSMAAAHAGRGIDKGVFDAVVGHLVDTLGALGVAADVIGEIGAKLAPLESEIVTVGSAA